ncbi:MAG: DUF4214 domain-containing protein [Saccharofermentans sp.]|nr:DUF4214 domain-containing protein [Saccharofermentans sp.]
MKKSKFMKLMSAFLAIALIGEFQVGSRVVLASEAEDEEAIETGAEDNGEAEPEVTLPEDEEVPGEGEETTDPEEEVILPEIEVEDAVVPQWQDFCDEEPLPEGSYVPGQILFSVIQYGSTGDQLCETSPVCEDLGISNAKSIASVSADGIASVDGVDPVEVIYLAEVETDDILAYSKYLRADERIIHADPNYISYIDDEGDAGESYLDSRIPVSSSEATTIANKCWYMKAINVEYAWARITNHNPGEGVVVAVIDTGVYTGHADLKNQMWRNPREIAGNGIDDDGNGYVDDVFGARTCDTSYNGNISDTWGHGTFVSGLIAAQGGNNTGIVGVAYGAKIMAVKASTGRTLSDDAIIRGIQYSFTMGANVINMSFSGTVYSATKELVCQQASNTAVLVAAAGNSSCVTSDYPYSSSSKRDYYPAAFSCVLGVMASTSSNTLADFSNWDYTGNKYQLIAPGANIYSTTYSGGYDYDNGTSFSSPITAGAAAMVLGEYPGQSPTFVKNMLLQTQKTTKFSSCKAGYFKHLDLSYCNWKPAPSTPLVNFATRLYTKALGRTADPAGVNDWACALRDGATGAAVAHGFFFSTEFTSKKLSNTEFVKRLYRTFFDREADTAGLNAWVKALNQGASREQVFMGFVNSVEWANLCCKYGIVSGGQASPNITPNAATIKFVTSLYTNCLGRKPDAAGLDAWSRALSNRQGTGAQVARGFFNSPEFINKKYSNSAYIKILYRVFLGREGDAAGINSWLNAMSKGATRDQVLDGFAKSSEFVTMCEKAEIIPF